MNTIKELFDSSKDISRRIESVVTFADNSEENLKNEINEYVVTEKLHDNFMKRLSKNLSRHFVILLTKWVFGYPDSTVQAKAHSQSIWDILSNSP